MIEVEVMGLDLSLAATGIATEGGVRVVGTKPKDGDDIDRADIILNGVVSHGFAVNQDTCTVWLESLISQGHQIHRLGMLHGIVRAGLRRMGIPVVLISPSKLKKYTTGKGVATKGVMIGQAVRLLGYEGGNDNEADALWLRQMGLCATGQDHVKMPKVNRSALDGVDLSPLEMS